MPGTALAEMNPESFGILQRMARAFAESTMIPEEMRTLPNCTVALLIAHEMHENPIMVMQNIFMVHGRPGWMAQYMINRANTSGVYRGPLRFYTSGNGDGLTVTCRAELKNAPDDDCRVEQSLDLKTAKDLGWTTYKDRKDGYKVKTHDRWAIPKMQEQMLSWRSATWLIRKYSPEVMFGLPTRDELEDISEIKDITPPAPRMDDFKPSGAHHKPNLASAPDAAGEGDPPDPSPLSPADHHLADSVGSSSAKISGDGSTSTAAPADPSDTPPDTGERDPFWSQPKLAVAPVRNGSRADWDATRDLLLRLIDAAETTDELERLRDDSKDTLGRMRVGGGAPMVQAVLDAIAARMPEPGRLLPGEMG